MLLVFSVAVQAQTTTEYVVQRGETLESIATKFGVTADELKETNKDAAKYLYVGMKLIIPLKNDVQQIETIKQEEIKVPKEAKDVALPSKSAQNSHNDYGLNGVWGITYIAGSFDDIKASGHYGFLMECYNLGGSGIGLGAVPFCFNFGLVDKKFTSDLIMAGPNYSLDLGQSSDCRFVIPAYVCYEYIGDDYKKMTGKSGVWGWSINPKVKYKSIMMGLLFSGSFSGGKVTSGFSAALVF